MAISMVKLKKQIHCWLIFITFFICHHCWISWGNSSFVNSCKRRFRCFYCRFSIQSQTRGITYSQETLYITSWWTEIHCIQCNWNSCCFIKHRIRIGSSLIISNTFIDCIQEVMNICLCQSCLFKFLALSRIRLRHSRCVQRFQYNTIIRCIISYFPMITSLQSIWCRRSSIRFIINISFIWLILQYCFLFTRNCIWIIQIRIWSNHYLQTIINTLEGLTFIWIFRYKQIAIFFSACLICINWSFSFKKNIITGITTSRIISSQNTTTSSSFYCFKCIIKRIWIDI